MEPFKVQFRTFSSRLKIVYWLTEYQNFKWLLCRALIKHVIVISRRDSTEWALIRLSEGRCLLLLMLTVRAAVLQAETDHVKLGHRMSQTPYISRTGLNTYESFTRHTSERTEHTPGTRFSQTPAEIWEEDETLSHTQLTLHFYSYSFTWTLNEEFLACHTTWNPGLKMILRTSQSQE